MRRHLITLSIVLLVSAANAQETQWKHYTNSTTPNCMIADGDFLWIGTNAGLVKFNRSTGNYEVMHTSTASFTQQAVMSLAKDKEGSIWAGTRGGGVARLKDGTWTQFTPKEYNFGGGVVWTMACDSNGNMWFGSDGGLAKYRDGSFTIYSKTTAPFTNSTIYKIAADREGGIWVATKAAVNTLKDRACVLHFDGVNWDLHSDSTDQRFPKASDVFSIYPARNGDVWFGYEGKVARMRDRVWTTFSSVPGSGAYFYVFGLGEDAAGTMYMTTPWGISKFDGTGWTQVNEYPLEDGKAIVAVGDELWFAGYEESGIAKLENTTWTAYRNLSSSGLKYNHINAMTIDSRGTKWFASGRREVVSFDGVNWETHHFMDLDNDRVHALAADSTGNLWLGTSMDGLVKWDGEKITRYRRANSPMVTDKIATIAYDKRRDAIWFGGRFDQNSDSTYEGAITYFDGTNWRNYHPGNSGLPWGEFNDIDIAPNGDIWFAMPYMGVAMYDGVDHWEIYNKANSDIPDDYSSALAITKHGVVWLATGNGAARYQEGDWTGFTKDEDGIGSNELTGVAVDTAGNAWFSAYAGGEGGLLRYSQGKWSHFTIFNSPVGSSFIYTMMADHHGNVYAGTYDAGVVVFNENGVQETSSVRPAKTSASFEVYPNPASHDVNVHLPRGAKRIRVIDVLGRERLTRNATNGASIDVRVLEPGSYFIQISSDNDVLTAPLIISR